MLELQLVKVDSVGGLDSYPEIHQGLVGRVDEFGLVYVNGHFSGGVHFQKEGYYYSRNVQVTPLGKNPELITKGYN